MSDQRIWWRVIFWSYSASSHTLCTLQIHVSFRRYGSGQRSAAAYDMQTRLP